MSLHFFHVQSSALGSFSSTFRLDLRNMPLSDVTTARMIDRDYEFAASIVGAQWSPGDGNVNSPTAAGSVLSDAANVLLSHVKTQQPAPPIRVDSESSRRAALVLLSFVHAETIADAKTKESFRHGRESHVWMMAVLLYDKFQHQDGSLTAWIDVDPFRHSNPGLSKSQRSARLQPTSPHYWMLAVPAQHHLAAERHCNDLFVLACYSLAFKWEYGDETLPFKNVVESLVRFSIQSGKEVFSSRAGAMDSAELILLDVIQWKLCVDGPLVHIDNLLWNAGVATNTSALHLTSYEQAAHFVMDPKMLSHSQYSAFYAACLCVLQACRDLHIPVDSIFGSTHAISSIAAVSELM